MSIEKLPNQITIARFIIALIYFGLLIALESKSFEGSRIIILDVCLFLFTLCAGTDWIDGYIARKYNAVSTFGRIADPMVDKILICGSFVFLASLQEVQGLIYPWMAVIVLTREFMIDGIRGFVESQGIPFPSLKGGKLKMALQCFAIGVILLYGAHLGKIPQIQSFSKGFTILTIWVTIGITIYSAYEYIKKATVILTELEEKNKSATSS